MRKLLSRWPAVLIVLASAATNRLHSQSDAASLPALQCAKTIKGGSIKRRESVPARDSLEACRAIGLSVAAALKKYPGSVDSTVIWRHDFPDLGTSNVNSVYQVMLYVKLAKPGPSAFAPKYVDVVVDRKTFAVTVRRNEQ
jgi:hypothetical protein